MFLLQIISYLINEDLCLGCQIKCSRNGWDLMPSRAYARCMLLRVLTNLFSNQLFQLLVKLRTWNIHRFEDISKFACCKNVPFHWQNSCLQFVVTSRDLIHTEQSSLLLLYKTGIFFTVQWIRCFTGTLVLPNSLALEFFEKLDFLLLVLRINWSARSGNWKSESKVYQRDFNSTLNPFIAFPLNTMLFVEGWGYRNGFLGHAFQLFISVRL